jgi:hypothetical protein
MAHLAVPNPRRHWRQENVGPVHDQYTKGPLTALSHRYPQRRNVSNTNGLHDCQRPPATQTMTSESSAHRQNPVASCCCPGVPIADLNRRCNASHFLTTEAALMRCRQCRCPRSRARLLLDCSDSALEYEHPEQEKMRAEVRGHGRGAAGPDDVPVRSGASRPQVVNPLPCVCAMAEPGRQGRNHASGCRRRTRPGG